MYYTTVRSQTSPSNATFPSSLSGIIPECAVSCFKSFIADNFPTSVCPNKGDLTCLCTHNGTSGLALGEGALGCVATCCLEEAIQYTDVYSICAGVNGAVPETHATITATQVPTSKMTWFPVTSDPGSGFSSLPTGISSHTFDTSITSIAFASGDPSFPAESSKAVSTTVSTTESTSAPTAASSAASSSTAASTTKKDAALSGGQIAGIAAASVASASLAFGFLLFVYCLKRKKRLREQRENLPFEIEKAPPKDDPAGTSSPTMPSATDAGASTSASEAAAKRKSQKPQIPPAGKGLRSSLWRRTIKPEEIGVAVSPGLVQGEIQHEESPQSDASYRTTSKLLPDKPVYSLWPAPLQAGRPPMQRPESTVTEFEEDIDTNHLGFGPYPAAAMPARRPVNENSPTNTQENYSRRLQPPQNGDPRARMYAMERQQANAGILPRPPRPARPPQNGLPSNQPSVALNYQQWPPVPSQARHGKRSRTSLRRDDQFYAPQLSIIEDASRSSTPSVPGNKPYLAPPLAAARAPSSVYSSNRSLPPSESRTSLDPPIVFTHHSFTNQPAPPRRRSSGNRYSSASDTSFESDCDDPTPDKELDVPRLSPVAESPADKSPISDLRYPKMPRPASMTKVAERTPTPKSIYWVPPERGRDAPVRDESIYGESRAARDPSPASSLLTKRRGEKAAGKMEKGLKLRQQDIFTSSPEVKHQTPTKWRIMNPDVENQSRAGSAEKTRFDRYGESPPLSARNFTPTRRGDDLFLELA